MTLTLVAIGLYVYRRLRRPGRRDDIVVESDTLRA